ncbi:alpha/beta hydrolase [Leptospira perolatii]|uniref:Alpha/beta hydrolase n=1 Tax=Leptospira perolatii TaxID=2023191 RepID=A0A2M9ZK18_9LEPT|nr:alpha/beta fold hydrolase [Leptospira perolatii]PJZ69228.1 alpha/beta hydrolase [Leptospira perolatii]PJZ72390.1 alpha/beta hydrolase [Leptospira perolatii]
MNLYETISPASKKKKSGSRKKHSILLVHGAWHGVWCWEEHFVPYFKKLGYDVYALSLRGHGKSQNKGQLRWTSIGDYVNDIEEFLKEIPDPPIVIGHSMGGLIVQKLLERRNFPAAILLAPVPVHGVSRFALEFFTKHPIQVLKVIGNLSLFPVISETKISKDILFSPNLSEEKAMEYCARLQDESYLAFLGMIAFSLPNPEKIKTPIKVLAGEKDKLFPLWEIKRTAKAYRTEPIVFPEMGHELMLDAGWESVANAIDTYIQSVPLNS